MRSSVLSFALFFGLVGCAQAPDTGSTGGPAAPLSTSGAAGARNSASSGLVTAHHLSTLAELAAAGNHEAMGFRSPEEARLAAAADVLPTYFLRHDHLAAYQRGQDPAPLLLDLGTLTVLVRVGGEVRTSMQMVRQGDAWQPAVMGNAVLARRIEGARRELALHHAVAAEQLFLVEAPALHRTFLGYVSAEKVHLTALADDPELGMHLGEPMPATEIVATLATRARAEIRNAQ